MKIPKTLTKILTKPTKQTKELAALGFISILGLATLFLITGMLQTNTGNFVYAGGKVQLEPNEACAQATNCKTGPAVFASSTGWQLNQHLGQYALCVCPEHVTEWNGKIPKKYDATKVRIIPFVQNYEGYEGGKYFGYE